MRYIILKRRKINAERIKLESDRVKAENEKKEKEFLPEAMEMGVIGKKPKPMDLE